MFHSLVVARRVKDRANEMLYKLGHNDEFANNLIGEAVVQLLTSKILYVRETIRSYFVEHRGALAMLSYLKANNVENWYIDPLQLAIQGNRKPRDPKDEPIVSKFNLKINPLSADMTLMSTSCVWAELKTYFTRQAVRTMNRNESSFIEPTLVSIQKQARSSSYSVHHPQELLAFKIKDARNMFRHIMHY